MMIQSNSTQRCKSKVWLLIYSASLSLSPASVANIQLTCHKKAHLILQLLTNAFNPLTRLPTHFVKSAENSKTGRVLRLIHHLPQPLRNLWLHLMLRPPKWYDDDLRTREATRVQYPFKDQSAALHINFLRFLPQYLGFR